MQLTRWPAQTRRKLGRHRLHHSDQQQTRDRAPRQPVAASTHGQVTSSACEVSSPCSRQQPRTLSRTITEAFQGIVRRHREAILLPGSQRTSSKHRFALLVMSLRLHHKCCLSQLIAGASGDVTSLRKAASPADASSQHYRTRPALLAFASDLTQSRHRLRR